MEDVSLMTQLEREGKERRQAAKAARKTPEAKAKKVRGKEQAKRGYRSENEARKELEQYGFSRIPLSGSNDFIGKGDLARKAKDDRIIRMGENKHRFADWVTIRRWLEKDGADFLRLDAGHGKEPLYVLPRSRFLLLLEEAGYKRVVSE